MSERVSRLRRLGARLAFALALTSSVILIGCADDGTEAGEAGAESTLDTRLEVHAPLDAPPTAAGLAYVQAVAEAHRQADARTEPGDQLEPLLAAIARPVPARDGTAELLHYELVARAAELQLRAGQPEQALALLGPRLPTSTSLPIDRAAARCLVALGDAAAKTGDHALAMGSYARALEMLSLLLEEVEP